MTQLPKETQKNGDTNRSKRTNKHANMHVTVCSQGLIQECALGLLNASAPGGETPVPISQGKVVK